jgi:PAS domain S-box-containing protein
MQELILILTQFAGGPGDPANNVVRFLLAAFFWVTLYIVSFWLWRATTERRHLYFSIAAAVGASREIFMFIAEYGSFRGYISFPAIFRYYPPLEHSVAILSIILMAYAFLRFYFGYEKFARLFLIYSSLLTFFTYIVIAPLWITFLNNAASAVLHGYPFIGAQFHNFWGDLVFRLLGALISLVVLVAFLSAKTRPIRFPWLVFVAFSCFFIDDALQAVNDLCHDRYAPIFAPIRHFLHIAAIVQLVGGYWWEVTRQLKNREKFLNTLMDAIPDHIFYKDMASVFLGCNRNFAENFIGRPKNEIIGRTEKDIVGDRELTRLFQRNAAETIAANSSRISELPCTLSNGKQALLETVQTPFHDDEGHIAGIIGVSRDITERRKLEEQLRHSQKMEAVGQLAGGVAHDLNNVLGVLTGYSELLLEEIPEGNRSRGHVDKILESAEKGAAIIEDLLTMARRGVTVSDVINLNSVVSDFLKTPVFERIRDYHPGVTFRTEYDKDLQNIKGSPVHMEKTLMNLVSNAAEAISGKGEVTIRTENRYLETPVKGYDEVKQGDYVVLTVSDTGMGIPAKDKERIFEPFYTKKTMGRSGTGLGLAIVWGTVKDHNGYIDVQTEIGQGTTFTLFFPVTREELIAQQQKAPIEEYKGKGESVLVVDDVAEQRDVAARLLARLGYKVNSVSSGEEAVEYLRVNTVDILVLDMIMAPGLDGLSTYQKILESKQKQKAILVSGFSETERVKEAQKLGAGAYVKKPYVLERIGIAIRDELSRK